MRRHKFNLILFFSLLLLGAYVYIFDPGAVGKRPVGQKVEKIFDFDKEDVQTIMLRRQGQTVIFSKEQGQWMIKEPWHVPADQKRIDDLLSVFRYGIVRSVDDQPADYKQYGLAPPELELGINVKGDAAFRVLELGGDNPGHTGCYARVQGVARVILVGSAYKTELMQADISAFRLQ